MLRQPIGHCMPALAYRAWATCIWTYSSRLLEIKYRNRSGITLHKTEVYSDMINISFPPQDCGLKLLQQSAMHTQRSHTYMVEELVEMCSKKRKKNHRPIWVYRHTGRFHEGVKARLMTIACDLFRGSNGLLGLSPSLLKNNCRRQLEERVIVKKKWL